MRRASSFTSSVLSRTFSTVHDGGAVNLQPRLLQVALFRSSRTNNSNSSHRWFSPLLESFSKSPDQAVSLGLAGVVASVATAASVYAKEPPPAEIMPKEVVLYQYEACPFCNKVKAFLDYYGIPYKVVEVDPISKKEIKWSDYKKVPILMVDGQQLVDSSAIIDQLGEKILPEKTKTSVADEDEETKWRRWVDNQLVHVLSPNIYRNTSEALESFDYITSNGNFSFTEKITVKYAGAAAMYFVSKNLKKKYNITDERAALYEAAETWVDALNGRSFLGGLKPNLADLAVFGVLRPIRHLRYGGTHSNRSGTVEWRKLLESQRGSRLKP
ncbi:translocon at the outer membrane of chloroplasts 64-like [Hibiscus syriacus]|uniref:Prostaglandin E synthase 2 n=1 Tax=Hibiscus syriacus TaxID=106335 RepID=A0A6A2YQA4_HIBSY|nr:translocon at the outer membrane of chloroplasts 64-like [Hibiscus syriacus]